jgi:hypothetical protein
VKIKSRVSIMFDNVFKKENIHRICVVSRLG